MNDITCVLKYDHMTDFFNLQVRKEFTTCHSFTPSPGQLIALMYKIAKTDDPDFNVELEAMGIDPYLVWELEIGDRLKDRDSIKKGQIQKVFEAKVIGSPRPFQVFGSYRWIQGGIMMCDDRSNFFLDLEVAKIDRLSTIERIERIIRLK